MPLHPDRSQGLVQAACTAERGKCNDSRLMWLAGTRSKGVRACGGIGRDGCLPKEWDAPDCNFRVLANHDPRRPKQANLRRAVSTAYYAMFHSLACTVANLLIGTTNRSEAWHRAYRALEHGTTKNVCRNKKTMQKFPPAIREFAESFVALQDMRHQADYALDELFGKVETLAAIERAENSIGCFEQANDQDRRCFVVHVLFKRR